MSVGSYQAKGITDAAGNVTIIVPPTTNSPNVDYVIIGKSTAFDVTFTLAGRRRDLRRLHAAEHLGQRGQARAVA